MVSNLIDEGLLLLARGNVGRRGRRRSRPGSAHHRGAPGRTDRSSRRARTLGARGGVCRWSGLLVCGGPRDHGRLCRHLGGCAGTPIEGQGSRSPQRRRRCRRGRLPIQAHAPARRGLRGHAEGTTSRVPCAIRRPPHDDGGRPRRRAGGAHRVPPGEGVPVREELGADDTPELARRAATHLSASGRRASTREDFPAASGLLPALRRCFRRLTLNAFRSSPTSARCSIALAPALTPSPCWPRSSSVRGRPATSDSRHARASTSTGREGRLTSSSPTRGRMSSSWCRSSRRATTTWATKALQVLAVGCLADARYSDEESCFARRSSVHAGSGPAGGVGDHHGAPRRRGVRSHTRDERPDDLRTDRETSLGPTSGGGSPGGAWRARGHAGKVPRGSHSSRNSERSSRSLAWST